MIAVYIATTPDGKKYVGITSQYLEKRIQGHYKLSRSDTTQPFAKALKQYGKNITWEIFTFVETFEEAYFLETLLIHLLRTNDPDCGYNLTSGGSGRPDLGFTDCQKYQMRLDNMNPILDQYGNFYLTCAHAAEVIGVAANSVRRVVLRKRPHTRGYVFRRIADL